MSCFYPMQALRTGALTKSGKSVICFINSDTARNFKGSPLLLSGLPCGKCVGCRLERSRQWAIRMMNENDMHSSSCFITLTFTDDSLFKRDFPMSLDKRDFQLFLKRLRKRFGKVRYFMCGEYGDLYQRPHYHAVLFGLDFSDKILYKVKDGLRYYTSDILSELWPYGFNVITDVTFDTCAYVARYIMKKHLGKDAHLHYDGYLDEETGELIGHRIPEYNTMSRRSGIGKAWLDKYLQDVYPRDQIFRRDKKLFCKPPKAYDSYFEVIDPVTFSQIKSNRVFAALANPKSTQQLIAEQTIKLTQISNLKRNLE